MKLQQSQLLMIEALLDGELKGQELLSAMQILSSSQELKQLYDNLKEQKDAIRQSFFISNPRN